MNTKSWLWIAASVAAMALAAATVVCYCGHDGIQPVSERAALAAAEHLLAQKLSGPRYFSASYWEDGEPWIAVDDAWAQVPRVVAERHLGAAGQQAIGTLIGKMSEPHPHRMVGGERINLSRFNLSLDGIK